MASIETDYLVVGAGAVGMAFVDTLLEEDPDCHVTIVDKHAKPGGHWNDAYSFVTLHQPSSTYGVNSAELCSNRVDTHGHNKGMYPLAKHAEILAYYERLMNEHFLPSGRVEYLPLSEYVAGDDGAHSVRSIMSGEETTVSIRRKLVDGTYFQTSVPSTHKPAFEIGDGTRFTIPGDLPGLWKAAGDIPQNFIILGAGKTAMDTGVWLLEAGIAPERIGWVRPRDSWMFNRKYLQPAHANIEGLMEFQMAQMRAAASSQTGDEMFAKLGEAGHMLRIDPDTTPSMFHFAVISEAEVAMLGSIEQVYRQGRVTRIEPGAMHFANETVEVPQDTLFIDCTASAVPFEVRKSPRPFFDGDVITLQLAQTPFVPYSAALAAFLEVNFETDDERNALVPCAPLTDTTSTYPAAFFANLRSTGLLSQNPKVNAWNAKSRLHPTGPAVAKLMAEGSPKLAALGEIGKTVQETMPGIMELGMKAYAEHNAT
ncbi:NAD(P)-binding protein [Qipengyuania sp. DGS5-3]|uniref:NAD(P)-binding protein n=1 Tax=Qipengyuania sp. DGS5-3 TaxID=3349632 RepID=UPI0036D3E1A2